MHAIPMCALVCVCGGGVSGRACVLLLVCENVQASHSERLGSALGVLHASICVHGGGVECAC